MMCANNHEFHTQMKILYKYILLIQTVVQGITVTTSNCLPALDCSLDKFAPPQMAHGVHGLLAEAQGDHHHNITTVVLITERLRGFWKQAAASRYLPVSYMAQYLTSRKQQSSKVLCRTTNRHPERKRPCGQCPAASQHMCSLLPTSCTDAHVCHVTMSN